MIKPVALVLLAALPLGSPNAAQPDPLGSEFQVNSFTTGSQGGPVVAVDSSGRFVVAWQSASQDGSSYGVFARRYDSTGTPLGGEFQVNTFTMNSQSRPAISMNPSGDFMIVWESDGQDGSDLGVMGRRYDDDGAPQGDEFQANIQTTASQWLPAVAMDSWGNFIVVWTSDYQDGSGSGVFGRRFDSAGEPLGGEFQVNTHTTGTQVRPAVAMDASGSFVVVWESNPQDGFDLGVFGRRYDSAGTPQDGEFQVNIYTTQRQYSPNVAMDSMGKFVAAWQSGGQDGFFNGVFGRVYDSEGAPIGGEFQVNIYTTSNQGDAAVAADPNGGFVIVWTSSGQDGYSMGVFGRWYDSEGTPLGGEFQVNTYTTNGQQNPALAMSSMGRFVVAWSSEGQDGSSEGVFGQRLACPDLDADALCDVEDVIVTSPLDGTVLDCSDPRIVRPDIAWNAGNFEKFRVYLASDPTFIKGTRVTSGDGLLKATSWTPPVKKWRSACRKAVAADPNNPALYVRVLGVDMDQHKTDPFRTTLSQIVQVDVQP